ncbi:MAG TPA: hypothetical protein VKR83_11540 [Ktedonobacteraceae bacterium]|nr:hypothetical protein [Ktedonobacteraceae bacterium]
MTKAWGMIDKLATGQKSIESRWYNRKLAPWGKISPGESIYFKNVGEPVTLQAQVNKVSYFSDLIPQRVLSILEQYRGDLGIEPGQLPTFYERYRHKRYAILIFLKGVQHISPFEIDRTGYGAMSAWLCVENVDQIRVPQR